MILERGQEIVKYITKNIKGLYVTGSIRRKEPEINDIDFITMRNLEKLLTELYNKFDVLRVLANGEKYLSVEIAVDFRLHHLDYEGPYKVQIDFWRAEDKYEYFFKKFMHDLDLGHQIYYKKRAQELGYRLSDLGLFEPLGDGSVEGRLLINDRRHLVRMLRKHQHN